MFFGKKIKNFEEIKIFFSNLTPPPAQPLSSPPPLIISPKVFKKPFINLKKKKVERRGRKPTIKEEDNVKKLYKKTGIEELSIFKKGFDDLPESPPPWFIL